MRGGWHLTFDGSSCWRKPTRRHNSFVLPSTSAESWHCFLPNDVIWEAILPMENSTRYLRFASPLVSMYTRRRQGRPPSGLSACQSKTRAAKSWGRRPSTSTTPDPAQRWWRASWTLSSRPTRAKCIGRVREMHGLPRFLHSPLIL